LELVAVAGQKTMQLDSISFDPSLPDPSQPDGHFDPGRPNIALMLAGHVRCGGGA
jgi:hypothetical protein